MHVTIQPTILDHYTYLSHHSIPMRVAYQISGTKRVIHIYTLVPAALRRTYGQTDLQCAGLLISRFTTLHWHRLETETWYKMDFDHLFIYLYCLFGVVRLTTAEDCKKIDECSCKTPRGNVDLHKLAQAENPRWVNNAVIRLSHMTVSMTINYRKFKCIHLPKLTDH